MSRLFPREDHQTNTVEDAAHFERWCGRCYDTWADQLQPTRAELEAEERAR